MGKDAMQKITQEKQNLIRRTCALISSVWTVVLGVLFIVQTWRIFALGGRAFTAQNVAEYFGQIAPVVWLWIAIIFVNILIFTIFPAPVQKQKASVDADVIARRLKTRLPAFEKSEKFQKMQKRRRIFAVVCYAVCALCFVFVVAIMLSDTYKGIATQGFFFKHPEAERLLVCMPFILLGFATLIAYKYYLAGDKNREITLLKQALAGKESIVEVHEIKKTLGDKIAYVCKRVKSALSVFKTEKAIFIVRVVLLMVAVLLIGVGVDNGGMADVLEKAINICTQCIGLG